MDQPDDPGLPRLPPPPSLPPRLPAAPAAPAAPPATGEESDAGPALPPADRLATRHVPAAHPKHLDLGLPASPVPTAPPPAGAPPGATTEFVRPDLAPMGDATAAVLVGRVLFAVAALLIGIAARRSIGAGAAPGAFWPVVWSAGVFAAVGSAGLMFWSAQLADNARRLRCRSATPRSISASWLAVIAWVAMSCLTYLRIEVDGDLDPMPGVAAVGWTIVMAVAYGQLQGVFRGLSRTPPVVWIAAFPIDVVAFGLVWWRLTGWPSPIGGDADDVRLTSNVAFGAAAALTVNVFVFARLAQRGSDGVFERLGRLEARRRADDGPTPEWFHAGLAGRPPNAAAAPVVRRPLVRTRELTAVVAALHVAWGVGLGVFGVLLAKLASDYAGLPVFFGDDLALLDADADRVVLVGTIVGVVYVAAIVAHGVWSVLTAINARRITVHSPNPGTFAIAFAPTPLLLGAGLVVGGRLGYWLVVAGLTVAFFALVLVNQMLMALAARLGGDLSGFSRWTLCLTLAYLAGVALNLLFARSTAQLGLYATLLFVQGVLIAAGGEIGFRAMRTLEQTLRDHRQAPRSGAS